MSPLSVSVESCGKNVACLVFRRQIAGSSRVVAFCFSVEELQGGGMSIFLPEESRVVKSCCMFSFEVAD